MQYNVNIIILNLRIFLGNIEGSIHSQRPKLLWCHLKWIKVKFCITLQRQFIKHIFILNSFHKIRQFAEVLQVTNAAHQIVPYANNPKTEVCFIKILRSVLQIYYNQGTKLYWNLILTCLTLVNGQFYAQFLYFTIRSLLSSTCFEQRRAHHQGSNCINTASGIVTLCKWPSGASDGHLQRVTIPDAVLIKFDLLMMSTNLLETCRGL